ncbi:hypothetical protein NMG60_11000805 [Bertholletia excelsa]
MNGDAARLKPTVQVPPWDPLDDHTVHLTSPSMAALHRFLPSNTGGVIDFPTDEYDFDIAGDAFSCDLFRMFEFKVRKCTRGRSHDWTECPYAHPGEKARRRDPRMFYYSGTPCPDFRKGQCKKGDSCEFAHGVFECWLHPDRYRTQPCKDGTHCRRRVCFFAHTPEQLRIMPENGSPASEPRDGSPGRPASDSYLMKGSFDSSLTSSLYSPPLSPPSDSPPVSPSGSVGVNSVSELAAYMRNMKIGRVGMSMNPPTWGLQMGFGLSSPRSPSSLRPGCLSLPSTPTQTVPRSVPVAFDLWEKGREEEPIMERVESGRNLRAKIYAKLSKENSLDRADPIVPGPDFGWISELVK